MTKLQQKMYNLKRNMNANYYLSECYYAFFREYGDVISQSHPTVYYHIKREYDKVVKSLNNMKDQYEAVIEEIDSLNSN